MIFKIPIELEFKGKAYKGEIVSLASCYESAEAFVHYMTAPYRKHLPDYDEEKVKAAVHSNPGLTFETLDSPVQLSNSKLFLERQIMVGELVEIRDDQKPTSTTTKVKVVSDGTPEGTKAWVGSAFLPNVTAIRILPIQLGHPLEVYLRLTDVELDYVVPSHAKRT